MNVEPPAWYGAGNDHAGVVRRYIEQISAPAWENARAILTRTSGAAVYVPLGCCAWHAMPRAMLLAVVAADRLELIGRN